jgi:hypothetical protein
VISNGGYLPSSENHAAKRTTAVSVGTNFYPVAAIRLASGRTDSVILPNELALLPTSAGNFEWELIKNPTVTGGTWVQHDSQNVEYNISATSMSGGSRIRGGFIASTNQSVSAAIALGTTATFELQLGRTNASTPVSDVYVLAARTLSSTATVVGSLSWNDIL